MSYELKGTLIHKGELMTFKNDFKKIELVVETSGKYPQTIKLEAIKDNAVKVDSQLKLGSRLDLMFDVRGNEYNGKYYNNLVMYKWEAEAPIDDIQETLVEENFEEEDKLPF
tara:strand:+ start:12 stop:347 length:336 start_codon:yes stop_codon:yes gene_type:complete